MQMVYPKNVNENKKILRNVICFKLFVLMPH